MDAASGASRRPAGRSTPPNGTSGVRSRTAEPRPGAQAGGAASTGVSGRLPSSQGSQASMSAAATTPDQAPKAKVAVGPKLLQSQPPSTLAGRATKPVIPLYQPRAVPRCAFGITSVTMALLTPSVAAA